MTQENSWKIFPKYMILNKNWNWRFSGDDSEGFLENFSRQISWHDRHLDRQNVRFPTLTGSEGRSEDWVKSGSWWRASLSLWFYMCLSDEMTLFIMTQTLTSPRHLINWWEFDKDLWSKRPDRFVSQSESTTGSDTDVTICDNRYCVSRMCPNPFCKSIRSLIKINLQNIMSDIDVGKCDVIITSS